MAMSGEETARITTLIGTTRRSLVEASESNRIYEVKEIISRLPSLGLNIQDLHKTNGAAIETPACVAIKNGNVEILTEFKKSGLNIVSLEEIGCDAVAEAIVSKKLDIIVAILDGYYPDKIFSDSALNLNIREALDVMNLAIKKGDRNLAKTFRAKFVKNELTDEESKTLLNILLQDMDADVELILTEFPEQKQLLERYILDEYDKDKFFIIPPLKTSDASKLKFIFDNVPEAKKMIPGLALAFASGGSAEEMGILLEYVEDIRYLNRSDKCGRNAGFIAQSYGNENKDVVNFLIKSGLNPKELLGNFDEKSDPAIIAAKRNDWEAIRNLKASGKSADELNAESGKKLNGCPTTAEIAVMLGNFKIITELYKAGVNNERLMEYVMGEGLVYPGENNNVSFARLMIGIGLSKKEVADYLVSLERGPLCAFREGDPSKQLKSDVKFLGIKISDEDINNMSCGEGSDDGGEDGDGDC